MNASRDCSTLPRDAASGEAKAEEVPGFVAEKSRMRKGEEQGATNVGIERAAAPAKGVGMDVTARIVSAQKMHSSIAKRRMTRWAKSIISRDLRASCQSRGVQIDRIGETRKTAFTRLVARGVVEKVFYI